MTLKELEPKLLALNPAEKAQAIQLLVQSLTNTWQGIEKTPGVCGGDACIATAHPRLGTGECSPFRYQRRTTII